MNRLLIDYWREWRPDILRWIAAILIFALFAWVIVDYFDYFDSCLNHASCVTGALGQVTFPRTFAPWLAEFDVPPHVVGRLLNHRLGTNKTHKRVLDHLRVGRKKYEKAARQ